MTLVLGFDPGGLGKFGCAAYWPEHNELRCITVDFVDQATDWVDTLAAEANPLAAGLDTLLFWQTGRSGWRGADQWLRRKYPQTRDSVMHPNTLMGAMSVQGPCLAKWLRERWPEIALNETHPKVLWSCLYEWEYPRKWKGARGPAAWAGHIDVDLAAMSDEHQLDAALSAWAAWQAYSGRWTHDLFHEQAIGQRRENTTFVSQVSYFWPE